MLESAIVNTLTSVIAGSLFMYGMIALFRYKAKFMNIFLLNVIVDIAAGIAEMYLEPLITRGVCVLIMVLLLKHFAEIRNWVMVIVISVLTNLFAAIASFAAVQMVLIPLLNRL